MPLKVKSQEKFVRSSLNSIGILDHIAIWPGQGRALAKRVAARKSQACVPGYAKDKDVWMAVWVMGMDMDMVFGSQPKDDLVSTREEDTTIN